MSYIFLFIWAIYSSIFLFFYKSWNTYFSSFSFSLLLEIVIYLFAGFILFFSFLNINTKKKSSNNSNTKELIKPNFVLDKKQIIQIIQKFSYYIWFLLFYISLFIFAKFNGFYEIDFSYFIIIINILIIIFFFLSNKNNLSFDFLKINTHIFSFFYIIILFWIFITWNNNLWIIDFINNLLIIISFIFSLYFNKNKQIYEGINLSYFSLYTFIILIFYINFYLLSYFWMSDLLFSIWTISVIFSYFIFEYFPKFKIFAKNIILFRLLGIVFLYFWIFLEILYLLLNPLSIVVVTTLIFSIFFNYYIHKKLENYLSFIIAISSFLFIFYYLLFNSFWFYFYTEILFFIISFILSFWFIGLVYKYKFKYIYDYYILIFASYFVNILSSIIFIINNFDVLSFATILFLDSIYFFASYYKMKEVKTYFNK